MALTKISTGMLKADAASVDLNIDAGTLFLDVANNRIGIANTSPAAALHIGGSGHLLFERGGEVRSKDTGGSVRTIARVDGSNRLQYGWSGSGGVLFMGGGSYTERMRIHTNGNVGIGITNPGSLLTVEGDIRQTTGDLLYTGGGNWNLRHLTNNQNITFDTTANGTTSEKMRVRADGNVGIGTASPAQKLHVEGDSRISSSGFTRLQVSSTRTGATDNVGGLEFMQSGTLKGQIFGSVDGQIKFAINGSTEGMRIDSSGRLLINTQSSIDNNAKLQILGDSSSYARMTMQDVDGTNQKTYFQQSGGGTAITTQNGTSNGFFDINGWNGSATSYFVRVTSSGDVGIGKTNPGTKLDVAGDIRALEAIYSEGSAPRVQLQDTDGTNQFSFFQQSQSSLVLRLRNDSNDGSFTIAGYGGSTTTNRLAIFSTGDLKYYKTDGTTPMHYMDASTGRSMVGTVGTADPIGKFHVVGNSDISDEDCQLVITDIDGSTGSRIPSIRFTGYHNGAFLDQGRIRGTGHMGLQLSGSSAFGNDLVVQSTGVGVGTNSPTSKVDIRGPHGATHSRGQLYLSNTESHAVNQGSQISLGGTYAGTTDTYFGSIAARKENATSGNYAGYLQFGTRGDGTSNAERMRITSTGNVVINTTSPFTVGGTARLSIYDSSVILSAGLSASDMFYIRKQGTGTFAWQTYNGNNDGAIQLQPYGGKVGINETSPDYTLHVNSGTTNIAAKFESTDSTSTIQFVDPTGNCEFGTTGSIGRISPAGSYAVLEASQGAVVINNAAQDCDFRVESQGNAHMLHVNAALNSVGMGGAGISGVVLETVSATTGGAPVFRAGTADFLGVQVGTQGVGFSVETNNYFALWHQPYADRGTQTNLTERVRMLSSGRIGLGHTAPNANLHINAGNNTAVTIGDATNPALQIGGTTNYRFGVYTDGETAYIENKNGDDGLAFRVKTAGEAMRISGGTGKVIIGDSASHTDDLFQIETPASGGGHGIQIRRNDANGNQQIGRILFGNNTDTDLAQISAKTDNDSNAGDTGALLFSTQPTGGSLTERMRIDSAGRVSIGTQSNSNSALTVQGDGTTNTTFAFRADNSNGNHILEARDDGVVLVDTNYLYVNNSAGFYSNGAIRARGGITNDGGNTLSIDSGSANINFNNKNFTNVGTISSGAITSSAAVNSDSINATSSITTGYGLALTNGSTNYLLYSNTGNDVLYMRDTTNSSMVQAWSPTGLIFYKNATFVEGITTSHGSGTLSITGDSSSNNYISSQGEIRIRPSGTTVNKFVIGSNGNLTTQGTVTASSSSGSNAAYNLGWQNSARALEMRYDSSYYMGIEMHAETRDLIFNNKSGDNAGDIRFFTGSTLTEKVTILANGNVGIGEGGSPDRKLHVGGSIKVGDDNAYEDTGDNFNGGVVFQTPIYTEYQWKWNGTDDHETNLYCPSYFMAEIIFTQHQTNSGADINRHLVAKWANNHTHHELETIHDSGSTWSMTTSITATDHNLIATGGSGSAANGRLRIVETYGSGSYSFSTLTVRVYQGSLSNVTHTYG